jgi:hypothetical protein
LLISGCANQLPPGGGEEDKIPPKIISKAPKSNSVSYQGSTITIEFDKYVDKRSFQDAFRISPPYKGDIDYNWSGKDVEIDFSKPFSAIDPDKTFVINISTALKDLHGNALNEPIAFAFSTGARIDSAAVSGKVYNNGGKNIALFAYKLISDTSFNPTQRISDYMTETSTTGEYVLTNLSSGKYRIIAVDDDDKNLLYTADRESYGVLPYDFVLYDSSDLKNINIYLKDIKKIKPPGNSPEPADFFKDSLEIVYSSIENGYKNVLLDQSIFLLFNKYRPKREDLVGSLKVQDEISRNIKIIFNWLNDSLVEIFPPEKYNLYNKYTLSLTLKTRNDSTYNYSLSYNTISLNSYGELKGVVHRNSSDTSSFGTSRAPVVLKLTSVDLKPVINYTFNIGDTLIDLKNILEADYSVFSFLDERGTGEYDYGRASPFIYSEPFYIYPHNVSIKGGWAVENLILDFSR